MLTIIYIYYNFTIINIFLLIDVIVQTAHFAKAFCRRDGLALVKNALGWVIGKRLAGLEQVTSV